MSEVDQQPPSVATEPLSMHAALCAAADHIERDPSDYCFDKIDIPKCGTPGCALGWIHTFSGIAGIGPRMTTVDAGPLFGIEDEEFYHRLDHLVESAKWRDDAKLCATALRMYADQYHPEATS